MPAVSIIMAAYNSSATLRCALASVCAQTFADFECWVVGDGCTDDSEQIVAEFGDRRLQWVNLEQRCGSQGGPNNEGLRRARGRYIAYLGHDDLWFAGHLASLVATLERSAADFVHGITLCVGPSGLVKVEGVLGMKRSYARRYVPPSSWLYRREVFDVCGPWPKPEGQIGGVDFVYQRRAALAGFRFACSGQISVVKFPSWWWKTYSLRRDHPQVAYWERLQRGPRELREDLLASAVLSEARRRDEVTVRGSCLGVLRAAIEWAKDWYGLERWPVSSYLIWRARRVRRRMRVLRGLPFFGKISDPDGRCEGEAEKAVPVLPMLG